MKSRRSTMIAITLIVIAGVSACAPPGPPISLNVDTGGDANNIVPVTMDQLSSQWLQQWNAASETDRAAVCRDYRLAPTMLVSQQANSVWDFVVSNYPADTRTEISLVGIQNMYQEALSSHC